MREWREIVALHDAAPGGVFATVVRVEGSAYRRPGARLLITPDGRRAGSISGGCLEGDLAKRAAGLVAGGPVVVAYDTRADAVVDLGFDTGCEGLIHVLVEPAAPANIDPIRAALAGGDNLPVATCYGMRGDTGCAVGDRLTPADAVISGEELGRDVWSAFDWDRPAWREYRLDGGYGAFLIEPMHPPRALVIFGDGDDARPLAELAEGLGLRVTVCGRRPALATPERFPTALVLCAPATDHLKGLDLDRRSAAVLLTHDLADDADLLPGLLASGVGYVGLLGPKRRAGRLMARLHAEGRLPADLAKLHAPAGLDLGGDDPAAVALSVLAEIEAWANGHGGGPLRERAGPIHTAAGRGVQTPRSGVAT